MTAMNGRRLDRAAAELAGRRLDRVRDYRVGAPLGTIYHGITGEFARTDEGLEILYKGWCERYGSELVAEVVQALYDGTVEYEPGRTDWTRTWTPPGGETIGEMATPESILKDPEVMN